MTFGNGLSYLNKNYVSKYCEKGFLWWNYIHDIVAVNADLGVCILSHTQMTDVNLQIWISNPRGIPPKKCVRYVKGDHKI